MSKAKEQHYVPCFLLRHFSSDSKKLWIYDRDTKRYDYKYDEEIQKLGNAAAPIIKQTIESSRRFVCPQLCIEKSSILKRFIFLIARRTPESHQRVASRQRQLLQQLIPDLLKDSLQIDDDTIDIKEQLRLLTGYLIANADARFSAGDMQNVRDEEERFCVSQE